MLSRLLRSSGSVWMLALMASSISIAGCFGTIGGGGSEVVMVDGGGTGPIASKPDASPDQTTTPDSTVTNEPTSPDDPTGTDDPSRPTREVYFADMRSFLQEFCINCHGADGRMANLGVYTDATHKLTPVDFWAHALKRVNDQQMPPIKPDAADAVERFNEGVSLFKDWEKAGFPEKKGGTTDPNANKGKEDPLAKFPDLASCRGEEALPARLWRLTPVQIAYSIEDAFGANIKIPAFSLSEKRIGGFGNNADSSGLGGVDITALVQQFGEVSVEVLAKVQDWKDCAAAQTDDCVKTLIADYGQKLWRRPLVQAEKDKLLQGFQTLSTEEDRSTGLEYVIERILMSANFLFRSEYGQEDTSQAGMRRLTSYEVATFLSFFLWQSIPDQALMDAAAKDELKTSTQVDQHVQRMLKDERAKRGLIEFFNDWLQLQRIFTQEKDTTQYPEMTDALRQQLYKSSQLYLAELVWTQKADLKTVFLSKEAFVNADIAKLYQGVQATGTDLQKVTLDGSRRAGILTSPTYLIAHSGKSSTGFVHRGVFFLEQLACRPIPAAPAGAVEAGKAKLKDVDLTKLTQREIQQIHGADPSCNFCHKIIDPAGAAFEIFDPMGRFRLNEKGLPIDASGKLEDFGDMQPSFKNALELSNNLAQSQHFQQCFTMKLYTHSWGRPPEGERNCALAHTYDGLQKGQFTLFDSYAAILRSPQFFLRKQPADGK
ncbi:MAG: DUF1592 domain-containing protein [Myxococcales bacterium]|nr:DUF1592 domain-containing protein [Myxococcales bacterium]MCB9641947.1 DUF1592 domain-containing protein [Myxococcales bacterium]